MASLIPQQKARATLIKKYGSWEAYIKHRYYDTIEEGIRKERASLAGKASKGGGFNNPDVARAAGKKSWDNRRGNKI